MPKKSQSSLLKLKLKNAESIKVFTDHVRAAYYAIDVDRFCVMLYKHDGTKIGHVMDDCHQDPKYALVSPITEDLVKEWRDGNHAEEPKVIIPEPVVELVEDAELV